MTNLRFAIIGCGRISPNHLAAAIQNKLDIVSICDLDEKKLEQTISTFDLGVAVIKYTDYRQMLAIEKPDLVAICTESGKHGQIALDCIDSGSHLIIEKRITLSLEEADQIIERAEAKNLKVSACHQNRFNKSVQKLREALEAGRLVDYFTEQPISAGAVERTTTSRHLGEGLGNKTVGRS